MEAGESDALRVLFVDDEPDLAEMAATFLERRHEEFTVETATGASEGLERLGDDVDCVVSDYEMPGRTGVDFLEAVRADYPDLPFVLFTGKGSEEVASEALSAGATDYLQKSGGTEQYELLANRIRNAVERYRTKRRSERLDRIRALVNDVNQALVRADSRAEVEERVCDSISDSDPYRFAWIGEVDPGTDRIEPRTSAGIEEGFLDEITVTADEGPTGQGPAGTAVRERRVAVSQDIRTDPEFAPWREAANERGYRATAAVPLVHEGTEYGVLVVYANRAHAFDDDERDLLAELGDDISLALHARTVQQELRGEQAFTDTILSALPDVLYVFDHDGNFIRWNERFAEVTGYTDAEIEEMEPLEFIPNDEAEKIAENIAAVIEDGRTVTVESAFETERGERIPYEFTGAPLVDQEGRELGLVGIGRDVSDRRERERRLQQQRDRFRTLFEHFPEPTVAVTFEEGEPVAREVNPAFEETFGYDAAAATGRSLNDLIVPDDQRSDAKEIDARARNREHVSREIRREAADGRRDFLFRNVPLDEDEAYDQFGFYIDITERRGRERELERQNERLESFASIISHDLRNPLEVASGQLALAREEQDSDRLAAVQRAHERMEALIDDLLALARQGEAVDEMEPVSLASLAESCWENVETGDATLRIDTDRTVRADAHRLHQLLANLFGNACEHAGDDVTVTVGSLPDGFYVADDGPGIPESERSELFEAGYTTAEEGTGFGLSIVEEIAEAHGWEVAVADAGGRPDGSGATPDDGGSGTSPDPRSDGARFEIRGVDRAD